MEKQMKVAAIVPAYNEEKNIGDVLKVLLSSLQLDEVIVVDDGSRDKTAKISEELGAKVIRREKREGKGQAMADGVKRTLAEIIVFFDADLIGLTQHHIEQLVEPILEQRAVMTVGLRERGGWKGKLIKLFVKLDPLLAIGGERAMRRFVFESVPERFVKGFGVETALNYYCLKKKLKVLYPELKGLDIVIKEKKWGYWKGFLNRLKMMLELLTTRIFLLLSQKEFRG